MKGVILSGGSGSRLLPLTKVTNKHLLPVYDEPMILSPLKTLRDSGIHDIIIVLGGESVGDIVKLLQDGSEYDVNITYVYQKEFGGIAEALMLVKNLVSKDETIAVILGDNIFEETFTELINDFNVYVKNNKGNLICNLFVKEVDNPERFGVIDIINGGITEKPTNPKSNMAVTGLYLYDYNVFSMINKVMREIGYSKRGELEITDVNNMYIKYGRFFTTILDGFWSDAGTIESLHKCSVFKANK